jgi:hypothetical protein
MNGDALWVQLLPFLFVTIIQLIPAIRLLRRTGIHPANAGYALLPWMGLVVLLFVVAYSKWPAIAQQRRRLHD